MSDSKLCESVEECSHTVAAVTKPLKKSGATDEEIFNAVKLLIKSGFYVAFDKASFVAEMNGSKIYLAIGSNEFEGKPSDSKLKKALQECKR